MKNYTKTSFDKSRCFNKREAEKMKKICLNQVLEPTFSKHVLEIDVDSIENLFIALYRAAPGLPARYDYIIEFCLISLFSSIFGKKKYEVTAF